MMTAYNKVYEMVLSRTLRTNLIKFMCVRVFVCLKAKDAKKNWGIELENNVKEEE